MGTLRASIVTVLVSLISSRAEAWVITEHEDLTALAVAALATEAPRHHAALAAAWSRAQRHAPWSQGRLCNHFGETSTDARCIRFAALPALAADHSCSPADLRQILAEREWLDDVMAVAKGLRASVHKAQGDAAVLRDVLSDLDILLQIADTAYATRAQVSTAHFQLARRSQALTDHLHDALAPGEVSNTAALFATYHAAALAEAAEAAALSSQGRPAGERALRAFLMESFALHFLEDAFAAGHAVGSWGDEAQRKGTHDYYNRYGLDVTTWTGESYVAHGDIFMTTWDERAVARAVTASLRQLAEVLAPFAGPPHPVDAERARSRLASIRRVLPHGELDACTTATTPPTLDALAEAPFLREVWRHTPRPPRRMPSIPRFRVEFGPFLGLSASGGGGAVWATDGRPPEGLLRGRLGIGGGFTGDGMFSQLMTGRVFGELLAAGTYNVTTHESASGIGFRFHAPYTFVPGDFVIGLALAFGPPRLAWMLQQAALGGAHRLNSVVPINETARFQFIGGREVSMVWYFPRGQPPAERTWRYEVLIPAFQVSLLGGFHQEIGSQWTFDLGLEVNHESGQPLYAGPYLTGTFFGRYIP